MDRSMISMIYFVALLALFLIMIIATIAVIASKSKRRYEDDDEFEDDEFEDSENEDEGAGITAGDETIFSDADAVFGDDFYVDNLDYADSQVQDIADEQDDQDSYEDLDEPQVDDSEAFDDDIFDEYEDVEVDSYDAELDSAFGPQIDPVQANAPTQEIDTKAVKEERANTKDTIPVIDNIAEDATDTAAQNIGIGTEETVDMQDDGFWAETDKAEEHVEMADMSETAGSETDMPDITADFTQAVPQAEEVDASAPSGTTVADTFELPQDDAENTESETESKQVSEKSAEKPAKKKHIRKAKKEPKQTAALQPALNPADTLVDSAFAPEIPEIDLSNEALAASVREAEAMGAAIMGDLKAANVPVETMFGINEELSSYGSKKQARAKSNVSSDEDFYWYNKEDVAERPARRPVETYYHHFNIAEDCIEDLLVEMYDCALVRTEEIRYIAYGIEPRTLSMKEIMSGNVSLDAHKKKEPTEQDMVRIYEKWCGYVDRLLDKTVEIHADEYTIEAIRKQLCAYGRNDVDTLLEGK